MTATVMVERLGLTPRHAHQAAVGGATGAVGILLARHLIAAGACRHVLVLGGENRLTGQSRDDAVKTLAGVGHPVHEVPLGASVPAYYALVAARHLHETGSSERDLAELAVLMRRHAAAHPGAQLTKPISVEDVMASKPVATPLKLLDCCPISDGAAAVIVSAEPGQGASIRLAGWGEAHTHQHVSEMPDDLGLGARIAAGQAFAGAGRSAADMRLLGLYDSFTPTLAIFLEALGFALPGRAGAMARDGLFGRDGRFPLNLHGGLLSYGHPGVAGFLAHVVEVVRQMRGEAGDRQVAGHHRSPIAMPMAGSFPAMPASCWSGRHERRDASVLRRLRPPLAVPPCGLPPLRLCGCERNRGQRRGHRLGGDAGDARADACVGGAGRLCDRARDAG